MKKIKRDKDDRGVGFIKYKNPDRRCLYPFSDDTLGYCWGFASFVDKKKDGDVFDINICRGCEMWNEHTKEHYFVILKELLRCRNLDKEEIKNSKRHHEERYSSVDFIIDTVVREVIKNKELEDGKEY